MFSSLKLNEQLKHKEEEMKISVAFVVLQMPETIPLTLYSNGIVMFSGPFRPFEDTETQICIQDIMDGYFPSELQTRYPEGVPFFVSAVEFVLKTTCAKRLPLQTLKSCVLL